MDSRESLLRPLTHLCLSTVLHFVGSLSKCQPIEFRNWDGELHESSLVLSEQVLYFVEAGSREVLPPYILIRKASIEIANIFSKQTHHHRRVPVLNQIVPENPLVSVVHVCHQEETNTSN